MSKFLTLLTTAVLVLLLVAFGLFLVRDKPVPTPVVKDPAYEAAIAPPESLASVPSQSSAETSGSEAQSVQKTVPSQPGSSDATPSGDARSDIGGRANTAVSGGAVVGSEVGRRKASEVAQPASVDVAGPELVLQDTVVNEDGRVSQSPDPSPRTYTVHSGDTLSSIAKRYYGNSALWKRIRDANPDVLGKDVRQIPVGMQLTIPQKSIQIQ